MRISDWSSDVCSSDLAEDAAIPLDIAAALTDTDGSETLSITVSGMPAGAMLSAGTDNGDGSWTLAPADLQGLAITPPANRSEEHPSELQSLMRISYAVFCLKKKKIQPQYTHKTIQP